jgi:hypothetical protein
MRQAGRRGLPVLDHLETLTDDVGIIQHAVHDVPNRSTGYCTDDVSRAFIVALMAMRQEHLEDGAARLVPVYLAYLHDAQLEDGRFHNFMSYDRKWLDEVGTEDSFGRAVWALGYGVRYAPRASWRSVCKGLFARALPHVRELEHVRARAYAAIGLAHAYEAADRDDAPIRASLREIGADLRKRFERERKPGWEWFEPSMTYDNARLAEAALRAGRVLPDDELEAIGLRALAFYEKLVIEDGVFVPIGNDGWCERHGRRARFGQQPLEAAALVDVALVAFEVTGDARYLQLAETGHAWFEGRNLHRMQMARGGGCRDGLDEHGFNPNMGAESTLAYLASAFSVCAIGRSALRVAK